MLTKDDIFVKKTTVRCIFSGPGIIVTKDDIIVQTCLYLILSFFLELNFNSLTLDKNLFSITKFGVDGFQGPKNVVPNFCGEQRWGGPFEKMYIHYILFTLPPPLVGKQNPLVT